MTLLNDEVQMQVRQVLSELRAPVHMLVFVRSGDTDECEMCATTRQLAEEVAGLSDQIVFEVHDLAAEPAIAEAYGIDKAPAIALLRGGDLPKDYGIRFFGIPSGYEFTSLIEALKMVSEERAGLSAQTQAALARLDRPVHIQVFVTPTCPYCPRAVLLAFNLAIASDRVKAEMVEANEFPELSERYGVYGVPRTVINDVIHVEGAVPEQMLVGELMAVMHDPAMAAPGNAGVAV
jgi:glutaredoxin-like protein